MRAFFSSVSNVRWCQHSHRVTRGTPSTVIVFQEVSSQISHEGTGDVNPKLKTGSKRRVHLPLTLPSAFCLLPSAFCLLPSALCPLPSGLCTVSCSLLTFHLTCGVVVRGA